MAIQVKVPALGESIKQALLIKWHKADGEAVKMDEPLCELETDKANVDVPATGTGVLRRMKKEGEQVSVEEVIADIDAEAKAAGKPARPAAVAPAASAPDASTAAKKESKAAASPSGSA